MADTKTLYERHEIDHRGNEHPYGYEPVQAKWWCMFPLFAYVAEPTDICTADNPHDWKWRCHWAVKP